MSDPPRLRWKGSALVLTVASVILLTTAMAVPRYAQASAQIFVIVLGALVIRLLVQAVRVATSAPGPFPFDEALLQPPEREILGPGSPTGSRSRSAPRPIVRWSSTTSSAGDSAGSPRIGSPPNTASIWMPTVTARARSSARKRGTCSGPITRRRRIGSDQGMPIEDVTKIVTAVEDLSR